MTRFPIKKIILTGLFSALTFILTIIIQIPTPTQGYVNLGDCMVLISGFVLGPVFGGFAAGLGSALADLVAYPFYAPATFIIKFLMAMVSGLLFKLVKKNTIWTVICGIIGEAIMVLGYFFFEAYIIGLGWAVALTGIGSNLFQAVAGVCSSALLIQIFLDKKTKPHNLEALEDNDYDEE